MTDEIIEQGNQHVYLLYITLVDKFSQCIVQDRCIPNHPDLLLHFAFGPNDVYIPWTQPAFRPLLKHVRYYSERPRDRRVVSREQHHIIHHNVLCTAAFIFLMRISISIPLAYQSRGHYSSFLYFFLIYDMILDQITPQIHRWPDNRQHKTHDTYLYPFLEHQ